MGVDGVGRYSMGVERTRLGFYLVSLGLILACSSGGSDTDVDVDLLPPRDARSDDLGGAGDLSDADAVDAAWRFDRGDYDLVHGWILLDKDPEAMAASIEAAAAFGVNHVQLSHGLIMNIEDILGDDPAVAQRVTTLNQGVALAHAHGMQAFIWTHELSGVPFDVCYEPGGELWAARAAAYREGLARIPEVDGVVLMFGSAPTAPWLSLCTCAWCEQQPGDSPFEQPAPAERIRLVVEELGAVIADELGKALFVRTFVHEPLEITWHGDGLASVEGVAFTGMHKGPVQDWQPYNPHHPNMGAVGPHPSVLELDLAGEYQGATALPYCAPGYVRYRMRHLWEHRGIGVVARVERGAQRALGTPNEINLWTVRALLDDIDAPLGAIWSAFLEARYGLAPGAAAAEALRAALETTFAVRLRSHYVLGIWAHDKGSDLPADTGLDQFRGRGRMPKWDPDWQDTWARLDQPDWVTLGWIWQEASEAVALAERALDALGPALSALSPDDAADLSRRLQHQLRAAEAWRAVDLFTWAARAHDQGMDDPSLPAWMAWAVGELARVRDAMQAEGLADVAVTGPGSVERFRAFAAPRVPAGAEAARPEADWFAPLTLAAQDAATATLTVHTRRAARLWLDYGTEIPDYGSSLDLGELSAGEDHEVTLTDLPAGGRVVARLRGEIDGREHRGGEIWIFVPAGSAGSREE